MRRIVRAVGGVEQQIDRLLAVGVGEIPRIAVGLAELGARLIIQRAVEAEFDACLGCARYERRLLIYRDVQ